MKELGPVKYFIENKTVKIWSIDVPDDSKPFLFQPFHPATLNSFTSDEDAEAWAIEYINNTYKP